MRILRFAEVACLLALAAGAAFAADEPKKPASKAVGFDVSLVDKAVAPCANFYQYACGGWLAANPIPPEYATWGRFNELGERNRDVLHGILEKAARPDPGRDVIHRKIGDFYAACMDEMHAEAEAARPVQAAFARIEKVKDVASLTAEIARLRQRGVAVLWTFGSGQDYKDAREVIAEADQGGLGLPDRDYYTKEDEASRKIREQYVSHMGKMFELAGDAPERAKAEADAVMAIETALAKASMTRVERRDPKKRANRMNLEELGKLAPSLPWKAYLAAVGAPDVASVNIGSPSYFKGADELLKAEKPENWRSYLRWHAIHSAAPMLSSKFVNENFAFYGTVLTGTKELQPRWKRCVTATDQSMRELLGQPYVEATFGAEGKKRTQEMVEALLAAMKADLSAITWMDDETKTRAQEKLSTFVRKIGYPDKWIDYGKLVVDRSSWLANAERAQEFEFARRLSKIGKPVDRTEWGMTPPTVNAYYSPQRNEIVFPAGILQPPFYDNTMDDGPNYGGVGAVIGHEITHGFDDQGRQFDRDGNLKDWWTGKSAEEFVRRAACVDKQFSSYVSVDDLHVNGKLTLGENIADLGGLKISHAAFQAAQKGKDKKPVDGFTPEQRFFLGWGQVWCRSTRPEQARLLVQTDSHSPGRWRVNGPLSNLPEFKQAFDCPDDAPMVRPPANACTVW
jgi:endothelin-converting enzyme/putative endopeptidase